MLEPGTYIDSHWGHYQSARVIELARELGWQPDEEGRYNHELPLPEYHAQAAEEVDHLAEYYLANGDVPHDVDYEVFYEIVMEAEAYLNTLCPSNHWFGHHADIGDVGVWELEEQDGY